MNIIILGSGGCISLPRPTCKCKICNEARKKGEPYKRTGCSLFIEDIKLLIDTPEDITYQINRENIHEVRNIMYSHWDPDHSLGMRILEQIHKEWRYVGVKTSTNICALPEVMDDLLEIKNKFSSYLKYYNQNNLCKIISGSKFIFNGIIVKLFPVKTHITSTVFLIKEGSKKVIYAPCDIKPFPKSKEFLDCDLMIIGNFTIKSYKYANKITSLYYLDEIINIGKEFRVKKIIITHIEEQWGLGFDDYKKIEKNYNGYLEFAYDSMCIPI